VVHARNAKDIYDQILDKAKAYDITDAYLNDMFRLVMKRKGYTKQQVYYRLKMLREEKPIVSNVPQRESGNVPFTNDNKRVLDESPSSVEQKVENITTVSSTNVIVDEENVMDDSQDARSESKIQAEVAASMPADDRRPIWHSMDRVQLIELVEATRDDNERNSGRCEELEDRNRELFEETRRLKKALFVQEGKKVEEMSSSPSSLPAGFVVVRQTELQDMQREIKALSEALKAAEIERDDFKEAATKSSFHSAVPKAGRIRVNPHDFIDVFHLANMRRQEVNLDHDGLRVTNAIRITGGERR